jgi:hypothetical protein
MVILDLLHISLVFSGNEVDLVDQKLSGRFLLRILLERIDF